MKPPRRKTAPVRELYVPKITAPTWTLDEKRRLLHGLRTHATLDPAVLRKYLPQRSSPEINSTVKTYLLMAQMKTLPVASSGFKNKEEEAMEYWLTQCKTQLGSEPDFSRSISTVLDALALIEDDSPPFSFSQIYAYLSAVIRGMKSMYLQPEDSYIVLQLLNDLTCTAKTRDVFRQVAHLRERLVTRSATPASLPVELVTPGSPALQPVAVVSQAMDRGEILSSANTTSAGPSGDGTRTSTCLLSGGVLPTPADASAAAPSLADHSRTSYQGTSKLSLTATPVTRRPLLAARVTSNPFDLDLQRIKSLNPLAIPAFLLNPGCKQADVCGDMKSTRRAKPKV